MLRDRRTLLFMRNAATRIAKRDLFAGGAPLISAMGYRLQISAHLYPVMQAKDVIIHYEGTGAFRGSVGTVHNPAHVPPRARCCARQRRNTSLGSLASVGRGQTSAFCTSGF